MQFVANILSHSLRQHYFHKKGLTVNFCGLLLFYSRKGLLSYRTPDFSKVEPRVRFPKSGYKPPKSKLSSKKEFLSPGPPIVFKSPADIVKEVLLEATDGPPTPSACNRPPASHLSSTVPQDFRCRQQATTLLQQLQVLLETEPLNKLII